MWQSKVPAFEDIRLPTKSDYYEKENVMKFDKVRQGNREFVFIVEQEVNVIVGNISANNRCNHSSFIERKKLRREVSLLDVSCNLQLS